MIWDLCSVMIEDLRRDLCSAFCGGMEVHPVPSGLAISTAFTDNSGDRLTFYVTETPDGFHIEDDGDFLADLIARNVPIDSGMRGELLDSILREGQAFWDRETLEIRTGSFPRRDLPARSINFLSSMIRVRDLALISLERVRSGFREDFLRELALHDADLVVEEGTAPTRSLAEFPADLVLRAKGLRTGAIYLVNNDAKLNEALLAWRELDDVDDKPALVAVIENMDLQNISRRRFQRAQNRRLPMPVFRGDEAATMAFIKREMAAVAA